MLSIKEIIKKVLNEIRTEPKLKFKSGMEHVIYPSKKNPNRLFKVGDEGVLFWAKVFNSNPEIFAKVFRVGKTSSGKYYAELEKLDTNRVELEWQQIEDKLEELGITGSESTS